MGVCGWVPREQHLAAEVGCTCHAVKTPSFKLPVSLLVWQLARHCTQNPNTLLESLPWIRNRGSTLAVILYYEWSVHRDTTVVKLEPFCFALPFHFVLEVFNPEEKKWSWERKGKLHALFSGTKYWESRDFSSCLSFVSTSCFFLSFDCVAFLGAMLLLSTSMVYLHGPLVHCEEIHLVQTLLSLSLLCYGTEYRYNNFMFVFGFVCSFVWGFLFSFYLMFVLADCFSNFKSHTEHITC